MVRCVSNILSRQLMFFITGSLLPNMPKQKPYAKQKPYTGRYFGMNTYFRYIFILD